MLLGGIAYDPAVAVTKAASSLLAMTAIDTTNLRIVFTVPDNGCVFVRMRCVCAGGTTFPQIHLGILEGSTIKGRVVPLGAPKNSTIASTPVPQEATFTVTGLTAGASLTWDAAYGVDLVSASSGIKYGGPNDTTASNAFGAFIFEIYDAVNLLGSINYDPAAAVTKATTSLLAVTAVDTTNLRIIFKVPPSGNVYVRLKTILHGVTTYPTIHLGVLEGSTVRGRQSPWGALTSTSGATTKSAHEAAFVVMGLNPGDSLTWDAAYSVEVVSASSALKYGGPDNTTTDDAFGAFVFEIWEL